MGSFLFRKAKHTLAYPMRRHIDSDVVAVHGASGELVTLQSKKIHTVRSYMISCEEAMRTTAAIVFLFHGV